MTSRPPKISSASRAAAVPKSSSDSGSETAPNNPNDSEATSDRSPPTAHSQQTPTAHSQQTPPDQDTVPLELHRLLSHLLTDHRYSPADLTNWLTQLTVKDSGSRERVMAGHLLGVGHALIDRLTKTELPSDGATILKLLRATIDCIKHLGQAQKSLGVMGGRQLALPLDAHSLTKGQLSAIRLAIEEDNDDDHRNSTR